MVTEFQFLKSNPVKPCRPNDSKEVMHLDKMRFSLGLSTDTPAADPYDAMQSDDLHRILRRASGRQPF